MRTVRWVRHRSREARTTCPCQPNDVTANAAASTTMTDRKQLPHDLTRTDCLDQARAVANAATARSSGTTPAFGHADGVVVDVREPKDQQGPVPQVHLVRDRSCRHEHHTYRASAPAEAVALPTRE